MAQLKRSAEQIYTHASPSEVQRLEAFRARCAPRYVGESLIRAWELGGTPGDLPAIFLPSGMAHGEIWFPYLLQLAPDLRGIALSLPPLADTARMVHSLWNVLDELGVEKCVLVGQSLGGMIAQAMVRAKPERVAAQVLITTGAPSAALPQGIRQRRSTRHLELRARLMNFSVIQQGMPAVAFRKFCPERLREKMEFWEAYFEETFLYSCYKKQHVALNIDFVPQFYAKQHYTPKDLQNWDGKTLIYESEEDSLFGETERQALRELYPGADVHTLGGGQFLPMEQEAELSRRIRGLLTEWNTGVRE